jgi:hypothetical protein
MSQIAPSATSLTGDLFKYVGAASAYAALPFVLPPRLMPPSLLRVWASVGLALTILMVILSVFAVQAEGDRFRTGGRTTLLALRRSGLLRMFVAFKSLTLPYPILLAFFSAATVNPQMVVDTAALGRHLLQAFAQFAGLYLWAWTRLVMNVCDEISREVMFKTRKVPLGTNLRTGDARAISEWNRVVRADMVAATIGLGALATEIANPPWPEWLVAMLQLAGNVAYFLVFHYFLKGIYDRARRTFEFQWPGQKDPPSRGNEAVQTGRDVEVSFID